jgi:hypothetical protein
MDLDLSGVDTMPIITCTIEGLLEPSDLAALASGELKQKVDEAEQHAQEVVTAAAEPVDNPADLKKLRERHHAVARLLASGVSPGLVATITGYTPQYISILQNGPAFKELLGLYKMQMGSNTMVLTEKLRTVAMEAVEKIEKKVRTDEDLSVSDLVGVAKLGLDRSGHGPSSSHHVTSESHQIDHARLAELNAAARASSAEYIVPRHKVVESLPKPVAEEDEG